MSKSTFMVLTITAILLSGSLFALRIAAVPTLENPTLLTSLCPTNVTIGNNVTWLVWTDPNCSGCNVNLKVFDMTNGTTIYEANKTLGTTNECGSLKTVMSTSGFQQHQYRFTAKAVISGMKMESSRYLDFSVAPVLKFSIVAYSSPYEAIPGDKITLTIYETYPYPYVSAVANIRVYNDTNPSLWSFTGLSIPSTNGSRTVDIPTTGLAADYYNINVTATSTIGSDSDLSYFRLSDIILTLDKYVYYIGDTVNVTIRTYTTVSEAGLVISSFLAYPPVVAVDEYVLLANGKASRLYNTASWAPGYYYVTCNATVGGETVFGYSSFSLETFTVDVTCDKSEYVAGEIVNITTSTTPIQPSAKFNLTITNSTDDNVWTYGPSNLGSNGKASVFFNTTGLRPDDYTVEVSVNNSKYVESDSDFFEIIVPVFNILANIQPYANTGYAMPSLNITVNPGQANANLTIVVSYYQTHYTFNKPSFTMSAYTYLIPTVGLPNSTYSVQVSVSSAIGTNSTYASFSYTSGADTDCDGLSDSEERTRSTSLTNPDSDGDGFFDGMEVFHGSNPLDQASVIPEQLIVPLVASLAAVSAFSVIRTRFQKRKTCK